MRLIVLLLLTIFFISGISALCNEGQIDVNTASLEELMDIKWVGNATAQKIIDARPFSSVDDLKRVSGLGGEGKRLADIKKEGLACVADAAEEEIIEEKTNAETIQEEDNNERTGDTNRITEESSSPNNNSLIETEIILKPEIIQLNYPANYTKDIKSGENSEILSKDRIATYGFFVFSAVIAALLIIRRKKIYKNDFR